MNQFVSDQDWSEFVETFNNCPHALSGKTVRVTSGGTNPYIFTDFDRTVFYNEKGLPMGSNSDILYNIGKVFGFDISVNLSTPSASYFDNKTGKWIGQVGSVRIFFFQLESYFTNYISLEC